jgi:lysophospholipase L1-like esterase
MLYITIFILCTILISYIFRNNIIMNIYKLPLIRKSWQLPNMAASTFEVPKNNTKPVVVFCGDSITHGHIGYDWVSALRKKDDSKIYINAGINADLTWNLNERVDNIIKHNPDYITILIGTNDAIGSQNIKHIQDYYVSTKGLPRLPHIDWYRSELERFITTVTVQTDAKIAISTLPWLGEQSNAEIITVVKDHNDIIRLLSKKYNLTLIDLFKHFEDIIDSNNSVPYTTTEWRRIRGLRAVILHYVFGWSWNRTGKKYRLKLLCDHIHLNEKSGAIFQNLMEDFINEVSTPDMK